MAQFTRRFSCLANGLYLLSHLGKVGCVGSDQYGFGANRASVRGARVGAEFNHHRQPVGETGSKRGEEIGVDGNKKVKGRKRHIAVDVLGLVLKCHVSAANCADVKVAPWVLFWVLEQYGRVSKILADKSYRGDLVTDIAAVYGVVMEISQRVSTKTFEVEPLRWLVERTWAWLDNARSLTRDYERLPENHAGMVYVVMIRLMLRRLTKNHTRWKEKTA